MVYGYCKKEGYKMTEQVRKEILKNSSPELREELYKFEIETLECRLHNREKHISYLQWYIAIFTLIQIILFIVRG